MTGSVAPYSEAASTTRIVCPFNGYLFAEQLFLIKFFLNFKKPNASKLKTDMALTDADVQKQVKAFNK